MFGLGCHTVENTHLQVGLPKKKNTHSESLLLIGRFAKQTDMHKEQ